MEQINFCSSPLNLVSWLVGLLRDRGEEKLHVDSTRSSPWKINWRLDPLLRLRAVLYKRTGARFCQLNSNLSVILLLTYNSNLKSLSLTFRAKKKNMNTDKLAINRQKICSSSTSALVCFFNTALKRQPQQPISFTVVTSNLRRIHFDMVFIRWYFVQSDRRCNVSNIYRKSQSTCSRCWICVVSRNRLHHET